MTGDDLRTKLEAVLRDLHDAAVDEERDYPMRANATWDAIEQIQQAVGIDELWPQVDVTRGGERVRAPRGPLGPIVTDATWPICPTCAGEGSGPCDPTLLHGVPQPVPLCTCGHRLANHAPPDRFCLRRDCSCRAYDRHSEQYGRAD